MENIIRLEVEGYDKEFNFKVTPQAYSALKAGLRDNLSVAGTKFLMDCINDKKRLKDLIDENSPNCDMTLENLLLNTLVEQLGATRKVVVKKS